MTESPYIIELNEENFVDVVVNGSEQQPILVDFWADWCGPCKSLMPTLAKLAVEYNGGFILAKLDTEAHPAIAQQLGIRSLPTVKLFKNKQLVDEFMGALPESDVRKFLEPHVTKLDAVEEEPAHNTVIETAMTAFDQGNTDEALRILKEAQAAEPSNPDVLLALGQVCVSTGDLDTAKSCLSALPEEAQGSVGANRLAGTIELSTEADTSKSMAQLQQELDADPNNSALLYQLGISTVLSGDMQGGMEHLLTLVQRDPEFNDGAARKQLIAVFNVLGTDPLASQYRRKLFALLH